MMYQSRPHDHSWDSKKGRSGYPGQVDFLHGQVYFLFSLTLWPRTQASQLPPKLQLK